MSEKRKEFCEAYFSVTLQPYALNFFKIITTKSTKCPNKMDKSAVIFEEEREKIDIPLKSD